MVSGGEDAAVRGEGGREEGRGRLNKVAADPKGAPVAPAVTVVNGPGI